VDGSLGGRRKPALAGLTEREVDVLTAIGGGLSNAENLRPVPDLPGDGEVACSTTC